MTRQARRWLRRIGIGIAGGAIVLAGLVLIVTPGPALLVIPAGIGLLALEFGWARRLRDRGTAVALRLGRRLAG